MRNLLFAILCCSRLFAAGSGSDLDHPDPRAAGMDAATLAKIPIRMKEFVDASKEAGMVTLVARHGHVASFEAIGYQNLEEKIPMKKDSMFRIASLTKPVTCAGIMVLVDEGLLSIIDPVEKFLPEYKDLRLNRCGSLVGYNCGTVAPTRSITISDLMTHTSGLPSSAESSDKSEPASLAELVARGAKSHLLFEPGTNWNYSNIGIDLLGRIIEVVSKKSFDQFLSERIFQPLGMKDTHFFVPEEKRTRMATLYRYEGGGLKAMPAEWGSQEHAQVPNPAGGLVSTAADMFRFNQMMRNGGVLDEHRVLSDSAVELMTVSHTGAMTAGWVPGVGHGFGYEVVRDVEGMFRYSSIGTYEKGGAYRTYEWVDGRKDMVGVFMMQRNSGAGDTSDEVNSLMQISAASIMDGRR